MLENESDDSIVRAGLVLIGDEILSGRTQDVNLSHLANWLNDIGIRLSEAHVVRDDEPEIITAVNELRGKYNYVFTTGGIGPTHDDITSAAIAAAFGLPIVRHPDAVATLDAHYRESGLNESRLKMAEVPEGATLIENPLSGAPGFQIENVFVLAGVPVVMKAMLDSLRHSLAGGAPLISHTVDVPLRESTMAEALGNLQARHAGVSVGSYPYYRDGRAGANLVLRATDEAVLAAAVADVEAMGRELSAEESEGRKTTSESEPDQG